MNDRVPDIRSRTDCVICGSDVSLTDYDLSAYTWDRGRSVQPLKGFVWVCEITTTRNVGDCWDRVAMLLYAHYETMGGRLIRQSHNCDMSQK